MQTMSKIISREVLEWRRVGKERLEAFSTFIKTDALLPAFRSAAYKAFKDSMPEGAPPDSALRFLKASREEDDYVLYQFGSAEKPFVDVGVTDNQSTFERITEDQGLLIPPADIAEFDVWANNQFFDFLEERFGEINSYGAFAVYLFKELLGRFTFLQLGFDLRRDRILALFHDELDDVDISFQTRIKSTFAPFETTASSSSESDSTVS